MNVVLPAPFCVSATFVGSLLVRVMNTVVGAGIPKLTGNETELKPGWAITLAGKMIPLTTDTLAVEPETVAMLELAVIVAEPVATPVTGTFTLVVFAGIVIVAGTVAVVVSEELKLTTRLVGEAADKFSARFCVPPTLTVAVPGGKLNAAPTVTVGLALATYPGAVALIVAVPKLLPVIIA